MLSIKEPYEFVWDKGNKNKNLKKHNISDNECEEVFFDDNKKILRDKLHSSKEKRYILLGKTKNKKLLFLVFTIRLKKIRIISTRQISKNKEKKLYEKTN